MRRKKKQELFPTIKPVKKKEKQKLLFPDAQLKFNMKKELLGLDPSLEEDELYHYIAETKEDVLRPMIFVDRIPLSMMDLKTLRDNLAEAEVSRLKFFSEGKFNHGWLNDNVIDAYLELIINKYPKTKLIQCWHR